MEHYGNQQYAVFTFHNSLYVVPISYGMFLRKGFVALELACRAAALLSGSGGVCSRATAISTVWRY